jgi:cell division protein ZapD
VISYEYPLNERIRTYLRLEHLFGRLSELTAAGSATDHHFGLVTIFEIIDVCGRADLKSEVLKDIERHRQVFRSYRGNPAISESVLDQVIGQLDQCYDDLNGVQGKMGQSLSENDWLMGIRSRVAIPGGTCNFDLPAYYFWLHKDATVRRTDLAGWSGLLLPMRDAIVLLLKLLRESGVAQKVFAVNGVFQQNLPQGRTFQLLRLQIDPALDLIPEISGNRLMFSIRLLRMEADGRLHAKAEDAPLELTLCA